MSSAVQVTRGELAAMVDHTLLAPEATADDVRGLCREAQDLGVWAACVSAGMTAVAAQALAGSGVRTAAVVGFPSGAHRSEVKALEARLAAADGAHELDMVVNLASVREGDWGRVTDDIRSVRLAVPELALKVILEAGALDRHELSAACRAAEAAGAQFVKTSTGFHPAGGATVQQVRVMAAAVGGRLGVKASGGIRTAQTALELVRAGATRLGLSRTAAVLAELPE
jgi:deoxyribose-phosphate aldolase